MTRFQRTSRFAAIWLLVAAVLLGACGGDDDGSPPSGQASTSGSLTVFAAASLTDAFAEIATAMTDAHPDLEIAYNFGGSQQLATQLADGADADLFASANMTQMTATQQAGVIDGEPVIFTRNRLAIVVPADNPAGFSEPADLANDDLKLVVANADVPAGRYTLEMLDKMSADPTFGADFRATVEANIVSTESNVRQVVTKVQLGEADAGVVYVSDITPDVADDVTIIEVPDAFNVVAEYPIAPVADGNAELARAFIDFVLSTEGQAILQVWGFTALDR
jgi:molybdate transport system substrate-binding protein